MSVAPSSSCGVSGTRGPSRPGTCMKEARGWKMDGAYSQLYRHPWTSAGGGGRAAHPAASATVCSPTQHAARGPCLALAGACAPGM